MRRLYAVALLALAGVMALVSGSASAAPSDPFQYKYSFDTGKAIRGIAVNYQTGNILVSDAQGSIDQFDPTGKPVNFSGLGSPAIPVGGFGHLAIDNTGGPTQGNVYLLDRISDSESGGFAPEGKIWGFSPDGKSLGAAYPIHPSTNFTEFCESAVSPDGKLWGAVQDYNSQTSPTVEEYTPAGISTGRSFPTGGGCTAAFDELGNFYRDNTKYDSSNNFSVLGQTGDTAGIQIGIDPSTNDVYTDHVGSITGIHYSDPLVEASPFETLGPISSSTGFAFDATGQFIYIVEGREINVSHREPPSAPFGLGQLTVDGVRSSRAVLHGQVFAGGAPTSYRLEYGATTSYGQSTAETTVPLGYLQVKVNGSIEGLQPGTTYHVRMAATNSVGTTYGPDKTFKTYAISQGGVNDPCPNALARKQTSAQRLPDCRAYELASAPDTGGYDVESYLAPGQSPFAGYPFATDKLLYSTHAGTVPGPWNATNKGPDPYVATRTSNGWVTSYEGLPADINPAAGSFSSVLGEADQSLDTLAFAGPGLCSPCFGSGLETGIPLRMPNGQLTQGMSGSLAGSVPASAKPEGKVAKYFSADGKHLVFASKYAFEPGANTGGDLTVYERDLTASTTEVVSTDTSGDALTGTVSELGVSNDGSRVITGREVTTDSQGNEYVHPYLHIAGRADGIDLAPGTTSGVLYAGMSEDGSKVFFTSADKLLGSDTDTSADLYEAAVDGEGNLSLSKVTEPNSNACNPVANTNGEHWNTTEVSADCGAVAISGGGGVAASTGAVYFLSPEQLDGTEGTLNQPNLYLAGPGATPQFVATLEPSNPLVLDSVKAAAARKTGYFQTTPSGDFAAFTSALELTGVHTFGLRQVFRYDAGAAQLACPSCDMTGAEGGTLADSAELAPNGLSLLEDGRLFFTTRFPLVLNDANGGKDVYEYVDGAPQLISAGTGPFDSALLGASAGGKDVFFFTHDALAPEEDHNGQLMRIYDAREGGGFFKLPESVPCQASDECHGPGTVAPGAPDIRSAGKTTQGNVVTCAKNRVKRRGHCVKPKKAKKKANKRAAKTNRKRGGRNA